MNGASNASYDLFGADALLKRLQALMQEVEGVRKAEDIEFIHRMRVASRRLRTALSLFQDSLPPREFDAWRKQIRRVTRALGAARDTDVQLLFLQTFLDGLSAEEKAYRPGIERLLLRWRQRRACLQADVTRALDRLEASRTAERMGQLLRERLVEARMQQVSVTAPSVYLRAYRAISLRLEELLAFDAYVYRPDCMAELHAMRIAAKRLRYTLEVFAPLYPDGLKEPLRIVRAIQEMVGDIHDCDVWVAGLPQFLQEERARTIEYFGHARSFGRLARGILYLQQNRQQQRSRRYQEFVELWQKALKEGVWDNLRQTILEQAEHKLAALDNCRQLSNTE